MTDTDPAGPAAICRVTDRRKVELFLPGGALHLFTPPVAGARSAETRAPINQQPEFVRAPIVGPGPSPPSPVSPTLILSSPLRQQMRRRPVFRPPAAFRDSPPIAAVTTRRNPAPAPETSTAAAIASSTPGPVRARDPAGSSNRPAVACSARFVGSGRWQCAREGVPHELSPSSSTSPSVHCVSRDSSRSSSCSIRRRV